MVGSKGARDWVSRELAEATSASETHLNPPPPFFILAPTQCWRSETYKYVSPLFFASLLAYCLS